MEEFFLEKLTHNDPMFMAAAVFEAAFIPVGRRQFNKQKLIYTRQAAADHKHIVHVAQLH
ncbi:MAG: hypothetical protein IPJ20_24150 [Flammeovirgaceae bacterium]|nr:hypothetical protein [Flammeovirgaceae bacterium]